MFKYDNFRSGHTILLLITNGSFQFFFSELKCDIALGNALSIHNTQLLNTYSRIDPRVRELVYIIKHWAKCRDINSPSHHTLSSYGYVLLLIHFLQVSECL